MGGSEYTALREFMETVIESVIHDGHSDKEILEGLSGSLDELARWIDTAKYHLKQV